MLYVISRAVGACVNLATEATTARRSVLLASTVRIVARRVSVCLEVPVTLCQEFVWMTVRKAGWEGHVISVSTNNLISSEYFSFHQST